MEEVILVDKPKEWTSFDVVAKLRGVLIDKRSAASVQGKRIKVGHAGTLDPFATGLLILLVGDATKKQDEFMKLDKEYEATLKFGFKSTTGDPEGEITEVPNDKNQIPNMAQISDALKKFTGKIEQTPPQYSAIKIKGKPAYRYARSGVTVEIKPRSVSIYKIEIIGYEYPNLSFRVKCSSGTYIRTLAEDIGDELKAGAYLTDLKRTKIGRYSLKKAKNITEIIAEFNVAE